MGSISEQLASGRIRWIQSPRWLRVFFGTAVACLVVYAANVLLGEIHPSNAWGTSYGIAATSLMIGAAALGLRRRTMRMGVGRAQTWAQFHVYGGVVFLLLVLMHSGFGWPRGTLTQWLIVLSVWITAGGLIGVGFRKWIPGMLSGSGVEVIYERIPELTEDLRNRAAALVEPCSPAVQDFYRKRLVEALGQPHVRFIYFLDLAGGSRARMREFRFLRPLLGPDDQSRLDELRAIYRTKLELDAHWTLQRALRWWLFAHTPFAVLLVILVFVHIFSALYY